MRVVGIVRPHEGSNATHVYLQCGCVVLIPEIRPAAWFHDMACPYHEPERCATEQGKPAAETHTAAETHNSAFTAAAGVGSNRKSNKGACP